MNRQLAYLEPGAPFPPTNHALDDPNGLLAVGGSLDTATLLDAYSRGIFPWYEPSQPVLWWSPDPRSILRPEELHISKSLRRCLRRDTYTICVDTNFDAVIRACASSRRGESLGTWISEDMRAAYQRLHHAGYAHSIEVYQQDKLVGGLYGVQRAGAFFGESMFSTATDASKVALVTLCLLQRCRGASLIDCQIESDHLNSLGARNIPRDEFEFMLRDSANSFPTGSWNLATLLPDATHKRDAESDAPENALSSKLASSTVLDLLHELDGESLPS